MEDKYFELSKTTIYSVDQIKEIQSVGNFNIDDMETILASAMNCGSSYEQIYILIMEIQRFLK